MFWCATYHLDLIYVRLVVSSQLSRAVVEIRTAFGMNLHWIAHTEEEEAAEAPVVYYYNSQVTSSSSSLIILFAPISDDVRSQSQL